LRRRATDRQRWSRKLRSAIELCTSSELAPDSRARTYSTTLVCYEREVVPDRHSLLRQDPKNQSRKHGLPNKEGSAGYVLSHSLTDLCNFLHWWRPLCSSACRSESPRAVVARAPS
jgi:hypothetical protein